MGMSNKQAGMYGVILLAAVGLGLFAANGFSLNTTQTPGQQSGETVNVDSYGIDGKVVFPKTPSSATVTLFEAEPENFGDYANWDASKAKQGLEVGVDYHEKTGVTTDAATFDDLDSGKYFLVVEDSNYNTVFTQVDQPTEVAKVFADNDKAVKLANGNVMDTAASYGSDNVVSYDDNGNVLATGTDLPAPSNETATFEITRTVQVDTGVSLLARLDTTSFNSNDGIEDVNVEVMADGSSIYSNELKNGASGDLADSTSFGEDLQSNIDSNPITSSDEVEVTYTVTAQMNDQAGTADDGILQDGESILTTGLDDVYGNAVSTATKSYTR